jgi:hypothetical protein
MYRNHRTRSAQDGRDCSPRIAGLAWLVFGCSVALGIALYGLSLSLYLASDPYSGLPAGILAIVLLVADGLLYVVCHRSGVQRMGVRFITQVVPPIVGMNVVILALLVAWAFSSPVHNLAAL